MEDNMEDIINILTNRHWSKKLRTPWKSSNTLKCHGFTDFIVFVKAWTLDFQSCFTGWVWTYNARCSSGCQAPKLSELHRLTKVSQSFNLNLNHNPTHLVTLLTYWAIWAILVHLCLKGERGAYIDTFKAIMLSDDETNKWQVINFNLFTKSLSIVYPLTV